MQIEYCISRISQSRYLGLRERVSILNKAQLELNRVCSVKDDPVRVDSSYQYIRT